MGRFIQVSFCLLLFMSSLASAQKPEKYFGYGLDSFYEADYERVIAHLDQAQELGLKDSRLFLYRGIAKLRVGNEDAGRADLKQAADLESRNGARYVGSFVDQLDGTELSAIAEYRWAAHNALIAEQETASAENEVVEPQRASIANVARVSFDEQDETDPFTDDSLGRGELVAATAVSPNEAFSNDTTGEVDDSETGFDFATDNAGPADGNAGNDGIAEDAGFGGFDEPAAQASPKEKKGLVGSIFSAIGKSAVPTKAIEQVTKQIPGRIPGAPLPQGPPADFAAEQDGAGDTTADSEAMNETDSGDDFDFGDAEEGGFEFEDDADSNPFEDDQ
ncbi:MAG: hypothetical protein KDB27_36465 [Planctomycetales bacterium]|nr:hypothetical protein [Planctomycetales bacterium]